MDTPAKAARIGTEMEKARRLYASAQLLAAIGRHREAVAKAYQASLTCGEAAVSIEGFDPKSQWGAWIQFGYLFLCHAKNSPGLGRMVDVLQGRIPGKSPQPSDWPGAARTALRNTKNILEYFGGYVRCRSSGRRARPRALHG